MTGWKKLWKSSLSNGPELRNKHYYPGGARAVFHGKRGELRQRYREGQEDQLGALGLVVNILALWNTIYMDAVLEQLRIQGHALKPEDVARLSPLTLAVIYWWECDALVGGEKARRGGHDGTKRRTRGISTS